MSIETLLINVHRRQLNTCLELQYNLRTIVDLSGKYQGRLQDSLAPYQSLLSAPADGSQDMINKLIECEEFLFKLLDVYINGSLSGEYAFDDEKEE
jgi:hypothetical protein